jgi:uncharacterized membrane protein YraQ (UPF0718 family)/regulator of protease activity HflC (stomatin/prohibitin superfamily)
VTTLASVGSEALRAAVEGGVFLLLGFLAAGLLQEFAPAARVAAWMGGRGLRSILAGVGVGAALPLCSCGVVPAAVALRRKGASREATLAFLISTPETGEESIALTWGLMGPFMALVRPAVACLTAVAGGLLLRGRDPGPDPEDPPPPEPAEHSHGADPFEARAAETRPGEPWGVRLRRALDYGFVRLMDELVFWLLLGFLITGILQALLPGDFFARYLPAGPVAILVMALVGVPIYICASASTPVAAALVAKGLSPGAALVFMLTGPATNAATLAVVARVFGRRFLAAYLGSIFGVAVAAGLAVDALVAWGVVGVAAAVPPDPETSGWGWVKTGGGAVLIALMVASAQRRGLRAGAHELADHFRALRLLLGGGPERRLVSPTVLGATALAVLVFFTLPRMALVVGPGERGLVRTLGRLGPAELPPGLHFVPPPPFARAQVVATAAARTVTVGFLAGLPFAAGDPAAVPSPRDPASPRDRGAPALPRSYPRLSQPFDPARNPRIPEGSYFVTGDENVVTVTAVFTYRVSDAARHELAAERPEAMLRAVGRAVLVEEIGRTTIDALYASGRAAVEVAAAARLSVADTLLAAGIAVEDVRLLYVHAPDEVHAAFRDVASAAEDRVTAQHRALADAEGIVRLARGESHRRVAEATARSRASVERARGEAEAFALLSREHARAREVTRTRLHLEAMERALPGRTKVVKPAPGRAPAFELWITPRDGAYPLPPRPGVPGVPASPEDDGEADPP